MTVSLSSPLSTCRTSASPEARAIDAKAASTFAACLSTMVACSCGVMPENSARKSCGISSLKSARENVSHVSMSWFFSIAGSLPTRAGKADARTRGVRVGGGPGSFKGRARLSAFYALNIAG